MSHYYFMTPEEQRIAIGEAHGWKCTAAFKGAFACWVRPGNAEWQTEWLPDYLLDLNAIRSAIMDVIVHGPDLQEYRSNEALFQEELDKIEEREQVPVWHFGAELYAEAFLKTLGLWKEGCNRS
jgi:hypothetical protein